MSPFSLINILLTFHFLNFLSKLHSILKNHVFIAAGVAAVTLQNIEDLLLGLYT